MVKKYFILGTDTNCGKTYVTCSLLSYLQQQARKALAIKPVVSGCEEEGDVRTNPDIQALSLHNPAVSIDIAPWRFIQPLSPHLAARAEQKALDIEEIVAFCRQSQFHDYDDLLIEGAGGLLVPLNDKQTWLEMLKIMQFDLSVILVVGMTLGCLNHALLTAMALENAGIPCKGWIANEWDTQMLACEENKQTLKTKLAFPYLGHVPYGKSFVIEKGQSF